MSIKKIEQPVLLNEYGRPIDTIFLEEAFKRTDDDDGDDDFDNPKSKIKVPSPRKMISRFEKIVYGQNNAKETLAIAAQNLGDRYSHPEIGLTKSNVLIFGPTGSGKTLLVDSLSSIIKIPIAKMKMTGVSPEGYYGPSISEVFDQLKPYNTSSMGVHVALREHETTTPIYNSEYFPNSDFAIIYLDEIDKISTKNDVSEGYGPKLQDELIGYIEDATVMDGEMSTKEMLFVCSGAFVGLEKIIARRLNKSSSMGFGANIIKEGERIELLNQTTPQDLIDYGFKPELVGRFTHRTTLEILSETDLSNILDLKGSYLSKQRKMLKKSRGITLRVPMESKTLISSYASKLGTNARGINDAINLLLREIQLDESLNGTVYTMTPEYTKRVLFS